MFVLLKILMKLLKSKLISPLLILAVIIFSSGLWMVHEVSAASLTSATDTMTNETTGGTSDHTFTWTSASGHGYVAADTVTVTAGAGNYTSAGSWVVGDFQLTMAGGTNTTSATNPVAVASSAPTCTSGLGHYTVTYTNSGTPSFVITLCTGFGTTSTAGAVTFKVKGGTGTGTLTNGSVASSTLWTITVGGSAPEAGDATTVAGVIITNDVVTVTATVNPTLTFSLGATSETLGALSTGSVTFGTPHTINVATNGAGGFSVAYTSAATGLYNGTHTLTALSSAIQVPGQEGWGINLESDTSITGSANPVTNTSGTGGSCAAAAGYAVGGATGTAQYTYVAGTTPQVVASSNGSDDCTFKASYVADISAVTPAGAYTNALTYIATATF